MSAIARQVLLVRAFLLPYQSDWRSMNNAESIGSLIFPTFHLWVTPEELYLQTVQTNNTRTLVHDLLSITLIEENQSQTSSAVSPECHSACAKLNPGPTLESTIWKIRESAPKKQSTTASNKNSFYHFQQPFSPVNSSLLNKKTWPKNTMSPFRHNIFYSVSCLMANFCPKISDLLVLLVE